MELEKSEFKIDSLKLRILKSELKKITLPYNLNAKIISIYADSGEILM